MDWSPYLEQEETVRWEGRPAPRCYTFRNWRHSLFGFLLLVLSIHWQVIALQVAAGYGRSWLVWIPVPFVAAGLFLSLGHLVLSRLEWEKVFYAVTDRRLLARRGLRGNRLVVLPLREITWFSLKPLGEQLGTLRIQAGEGRAELVLCCVEHPRRLTDLIEEQMVRATPPSACKCS